MCECFDCFNIKNQDKDITQTNVELKDVSEDFAITLERGKILSYFGTRFAKIDNNGVIHIFKDYMG